MQQLVDLLAGEVAALGQLAERPLPVGPRLLDHLAALLLGHRDLGLGVCLGVPQALRGLGLGGVAQLLRGLGRLPNRALGGLLGLDADGAAALARHLHDACRLLAEQAGDRLVVELSRQVGTLLAQRPHLVVEVTLPLLQAGELGGDHAEEVAHLVLVEAAARRWEAGVGNRRRR